MTDLHVLLSLARLATAALAGTIAVLGLRAYVRARRRSLAALAAGAGLLALGYLAEGVLVEVGGWSVASATVLESVVTLVAVAILVASLYLRDARRGRVPPPSGSGERAPRSSPP